MKEARRSLKNRPVARFSIALVVPGSAELFFVCRFTLKIGILKL